jgi:protein-tyrosine phosphatase
MIDTHLHILPGVDDGPDTMEDTIALARVLVQEGVHAAIATPHYNDEYPRYPVAEIQARVYEVQQVLDRHAIPLRLFPGHEVLIKPGLVEDIQSGRAATLNGSRYLLLELWPSSWLPETERVIFELRAAGIIPVLAHVERYQTFQRDPQRLAALLQQGVLAQVTAGSLVGMQGKTARRTTEALLKKGLIHCIGSDAHGLQKRPPAVAQGLQCAQKLLSQQRIYQISELWPRAIINNEWYQA